MRKMNNTLKKKKAKKTTKHLLLLYLQIINKRRFNGFQHIMMDLKIYTHIMIITNFLHIIWKMKFKDIVVELYWIMNLKILVIKICVLAKEKKMKLLTE